MVSFFFILMLKIIPLKVLFKISKIFESINPEISKILTDIKTPITDVEFYKLFEFPEIPKIFSYKKDNMIIKQVYNLDEKYYQLLIDGNQWMTFDLNTYEQLFELYSHYNLAKGHCICTGLGFGLREKWLLSKKEVSKITVLEKNIAVINYHKQLNPDLMSQVEVIHCDASEYIGECDTLLLDHYEFEFHDLSKFFQNIKKCYDNIKHTSLWFWPLEAIVTDGLSKKDKNLSKNKYEKYLNLMKMYSTLPNITECELNSYCDIYHFFHDPLTSM